MKFRTNALTICPYSWETVLDFCRPSFLKKQVDETTNALDYILSGKDSIRDPGCVADMDPHLKKGVTGCQQV